MCIGILTYSEITIKNVGRNPYHRRIPERVRLFLRTRGEREWSRVKIASSG